MPATKKKARKGAPVNDQHVAGLEIHIEHLAVLDRAGAAEWHPDAKIAAAERALVQAGSRGFDPRHVKTLLECDMDEAIAAMQSLAHRCATPLRYS